MSFTWKFTKPVSKATLTGNSSPSYTTNTAAGTKFTWPAGAGDDPTYDILKAQIDELRANLDSADDVGKIRCSSHYGTVLTSKYDTHCPGQYTTHKYCTTYYSGHYNPTVCSYTYSARYNSKYGARYNSRTVCTNDHSYNWAGDNSPDYDRHNGENWYRNQYACTQHNDANWEGVNTTEDTTDDHGDDSSDYKQDCGNNEFYAYQNWSTDNSDYCPFQESTDYETNNDSNRNTHDSNNNTSRYSKHNSSFCSNDG